MATAGLFILVAVLDTVPLRANFSYLTKLSRVIPAGNELDPGILSQIQTHPDVEQVIPENGLGISLPTLLGTESQRLLGVSVQDAERLMQYCGVRLQQGRMFAPRSNEFVLSEEVARALKLQLGDEIGRELDRDYYGAVADPLVLVGILEGDRSIHPGPSIRLGFVSGEYLNSHEQYAPRPAGLLVIAKQDRKAVVDAFLATTIDTPSTNVETFAEIDKYVRMARTATYVLFGIVNSVAGVVVALVVGIINQIAMTRRLSEFGLLNALGHHRRDLVRRMTLETVVIALAGTLIGLVIAFLGVLGIKNSLFYNLGMEMSLYNLTPLWFVLPTPAIVILLAFRSLRRAFARLDAVSIVEQGQLSSEESDQRTASRSSTNPLSSWTFYLRHRNRGLLLVLSTALMVLGTSLPVFLFSSMTSAMKPYYEHLRYLSRVSPIQSELDPGVVSQVRNHPAVAQTIPTIPLNMYMVMPPGGGTSVQIYGVSETDLPILLEQLGMQVQEGRLPRPRSNEIVISSAMAANRRLSVGDMVGGEIDPGDTLATDDLPTEMVVSGILSPDRPWIGFASYEYLRSHEVISARRTHLLLVPHEGAKAELDDWLAEQIASNQVGITTYADRDQDYREMTTSISLTFALLECLIAAVAAVALATLNYVFIAQRREELGVLNAMGRSRRWLVLRLIKETGSTAGLAWIIGAIICSVGLVVVQKAFYAPRGLTLGLFNPIPWLFTTPLPVSIIMVSAITVTHMLTRLDPVAVVERRT